MDAQNTVTQTTVTSSSTPATNPIIDPTEKKKSLPVAMSLLIILLILSLGALVYFVFQNMQLNKQIEAFKVGYQVATNLASPTPVATADPTADWKTYTNQKVGYTANYPSDWQTKLTEPTTSQESQGNNTTTIAFSKDDYELTITTSSLGGGGIICKFDDSTQDEFAGPATDKLGASYDIGTFLGMPARRNLNPITNVNQYGTLRQSIVYTYEACVPIESDLKRSDNKLGYTSTINKNNLIIYNEYHTPQENINNNNLKIMDQILSTFKFTN